MRFSTFATIICAVALAAGPAAAVVNPIPGIGLVVKKNPGGGAHRLTPTNADGRSAWSSEGAGTYDVTLSGPALDKACSGASPARPGTPLSGPVLTVRAGDAVVAAVSACGGSAARPTAVVTLTAAQAASPLSLEVAVVSPAVASAAAAPRAGAAIRAVPAQATAAPAPIRALVVGDRVVIQLGDAETWTYDPNTGAITTDSPSAARVAGGPVTGTIVKGGQNPTAQSVAGAPIKGIIVKGGQNPGASLATGSPIGGLVVKGGKNPGGSQFTSLRVEDGGVILPGEAPNGDYTLILQIPRASLPGPAKAAGPRGVQIEFALVKSDAGWTHARGTNGSPKTPGF